MKLAPPEVNLAAAGWGQDCTQHAASASFSVSLLSAPREKSGYAYMCKNFLEALYKDTCVRVRHGLVHCARMSVLMLGKDVCVYVRQGCACSCYIWRHVFILGKDMRIVQDTCVHVGQGCVHCARTHVFMLSKDLFIVQGCRCSC